MSPEHERGVVLLRRCAAACALLAILLLAWFLYDARAAGDTDAGIVLFRSLFSLKSRAAIVLGLAALVLGALAVYTNHVTGSRGAVSTRKAVVAIGVIATVAAAIISITGCLLPAAIFLAPRPQSMPATDAPGLEFMFPICWGASIFTGILAVALAEATIRSIRTGRSEK